MMSFFSLLLGIGARWHRYEIQVFRWQIFVSIAFFAVGIVPSMFIPLIFPYWVKLVWLEAWMILGSLYTLFSFSNFNTALVGTELGWLLERGRGHTHSRGLIADAGASAYNYAQLIGALLASELVVAMLALIIPAHWNIPLSVLLLLATLTIIAHTVWQAGEFYWQKIVIAIAWSAFALALFGILVPGLFPLATQRVLSPLQGGGADTALVSGMSGRASTATKVWIGFFSVATVAILSAVVKSLRGVSASHGSH